MENKKFTELLWKNKYSEKWFEEFFELKKKASINMERPNLAFQIVETINQPRVKGGAQKSLFPEKDWPENYPKDWKNLLIWGDNKLVMSSLLKDFAGKINLIYIDPPFFTGADFTVKTKVGDEEVVKEPSIIEEKAYRDTWAGGMASYLKYMYERLVLMKELLTEDGSIYVHCDWHVSHYLKCMMDEIFGYENFLNEIVWYYRSGGIGRTWFSRRHDTLLLYSKTQNYFYNGLAVGDLREQSEGTFGGYFGVDKEGRRYRELRKGGKVYKYYMDEPKNPDDVWIVPQIPERNKMERTDFQTQKPEALIRRTILASSKEGDIVGDFFCGSGTTGVLAEKYGRRWIMADLSKFAVHTTRKRLMDVHNSDKTLNEFELIKGYKNCSDCKKKIEIHEEYKNKIIIYGKPARPFEILNIGKYELEYLNGKEQDYLKFMLRLYQAEDIKGFKYIHGKKGIRLVHIGSLNAPVSMEEVRNTIKECADNKITKLDILGWEWSYEVNDLAKHLAKEHKIDLRLIQIPSVNEIKSALVGFDLKLLKIPEQVIDEKILKNIRFSEVSYLEVEPKIQGKKVTIRIIDFQVPPSDWLDEIKDSIKKYSDLIDYWAIDWDYKGDTFHNQWQAYRTKKESKIEIEATKTHEKAGEYQIMVKVVDVFGNDTNKIIKVKIR